ncbi:MAG: hydroxyacid dehydrogenase [Fibrella sp.]|nr:hydroxyacid dehydrogenase [Armatimonadota bacterium]
MMKSVLLGDPNFLNKIYTAAHRERIATQTELLPEIIAPSSLATSLSPIADADMLFSTWGMPLWTSEQLEELPRLKVVFYAAGSVQGFARPLLDRGVRVVSGWRANAIPVAEFVLSQILLANKGYFRNIREHRGGATFQTAYRGAGNYDATVALLGAGAITRMLIGLLKPFRLRVLVYDPYISAEDAAWLGVECVSLETAFARADVVSNHLPDKDETAGLLRADLFNRLRLGATFINTGRGRTVNEAELEGTMRSRADLTALLDVTHPEPTSEDAPLLKLGNVLVSTHIAGSIGNEIQRLADYCVEEMERYVRSERFQHEVTMEMLDHLA